MERNAEEVCSKKKQQKSAKHDEAHYGSSTQKPDKTAEEYEAAKKRRIKTLEIKVAKRIEIEEGIKPRKFSITDQAEEVDDNRIKCREDLQDEAINQYGKYGNKAYYIFRRTIRENEKHRKYEKNRVLASLAPLLIGS